MNRFIFWDTLKSRVNDDHIGLGLYVGYVKKKQYRMLASVHKLDNGKFAWHTFDTQGGAGIEGVETTLEQAQKEAAHAIIQQNFIDLGKLNGK